MRYALSALLVAHGVVHLVGFLVPWRLMAAPDTPFKTTLLAGRVDVGQAGIRAVGVFWLLTAVVLVATALGLAVQARWAGSLVLPVLAVSLALCLVELPQARIGLWLNGVLVPLILLHPQLSPGVVRWQLNGDSVRARLDASAHGLARTFTSDSVDSLPTPVTCRDYAVQNGMRIPTYCEAAWKLDTGPLCLETRHRAFVYWKGRISR